MGGILTPLIALVLIFFQQDAIGRTVTGPLDPGRTVLAMLGYVLVATLLVRLPVRRYVRAGRPGPFQPMPGGDVLHLGLFALFVFGTDWVALVQRHVTDWPILSSLVAFLPFVAAEGLRTAAGYDALPAHRRGPGKRRGLVTFRLRVLALPALPILLLQGLRSLVWRQPHWGRLFEAYTPLFVIFLLVSLGLVFALAPLLVRWILLARPLPDGPLRERLLQYCRSVGFKPNDVLVWNTGGTVTNALFIGILPFLRYVVLTDELMTRLTDAQVEAVFAHETGHGARRHTQLYLLFAFGFTMLMVAYNPLLEWLGPVLESLAAAGGGVAVNMAVMFLSLVTMFVFFGAFGWMSRRFETEADIYAVETLEQPETFPEALERVGLHMGAAARRGGGMRHFGIGTRIGLLERYRCEPEFRRYFDRILRRCRLIIFGTFAVGLVPTVLTAPKAIELGHASMVDLLARDADEALRQEDRREARRLLAEAQELLPHADRLGRFNYENVGLVLESLQGRGDPETARELMLELERIDREQPLTPQSVGATASDLFLAGRALDDGFRSPVKPVNWTAAGRLLHVLDGLEDDDAPPAELVRLVREAEEDLSYRRELFERATGGLGPRAAVRERFPDLDR